jgi:DDE domain
MTPPADTERYKNHRFPGEIISHGVWLYYRFTLSYRDVEELLFERGITVSHEAIRQWCQKFGQDYANRLRRRRPQPGDKWHLDEVFLTIHGERHYLWRAVDQDENVLDILVQSRRNKHAAKKFFRKLLKGLQYVPRVVITDKLTRVMARPSGRYCLGSNTARVAISITGVRTPIGQRVSVSVVCRGLSQQVMRSASCLPMVLSPNTSDRDDICCQRPRTDKR